MKKPLSLALLLSLFAISLPAGADEGMWTFDHFPAAKVKAAFGFAPSRAWLDHVRLSSGRLPGCSSSFVSAQGLVMTNHHCAVSCLAALSSKGQDYVATGFYAKRLEDEVKCPGVDVLQLAAITDVTKAIDNARAGKSGRALLDAERTKSLELRRACGRSETVRCDVVTLYHGGASYLYRYNRFGDVRLVFAPEFSVAQFGGDPDNFNFPRYDYDLTFLRVCVNDQPAATPEHLGWSKAGARSGELVFVPGHPGGTRRELTVAQLAYIRDVDLPHRIPDTAEYRGILERYQDEGPEQKRQSNETLFFLENTYKELLGEQQALLDPQFFGQKVAEERALLAAVAKNKELQALYGSAWDELARVQVRKAQLRVAEQYVAGGPRSRLFGYARTLVRLAAERTKPEAQRLPGFDDASLPAATRRLQSRVPVYRGSEELLLAFWAKRVREELGPDDSFVKTVLGSQSPAQWAYALVAGTKLDDAATRSELMNGGQSGIEASTDTMIRFAAGIDAVARAARRKYDDEVTAPEAKASQLVAKARFAVLGTSIDPDATFSLRLSYGSVKGFPDANGTAVAPFTTISGLYARATGADPYELPKSWLDAKPSLDVQTPMNLSTTNDIIGGNSGSPLIDKDGDVVGLIFDGNIYSLGGDFGFDARRNRAIAVDSRTIIAALRSVYHADRILSEIGQ